MEIKEMEIINKVRSVLYHDLDEILNDFKNDIFLNKLRQIVSDICDLMGKSDYYRELYSASKIIADLIEDIEKRLELEKKLLKGGDIK